jgi:putative transcriptional regulator
MPKRRDTKTREICERIQGVFGERLKALRTDRGMGQKALAPHMQLSRTSVSNLECGLHLPSLDEVYRAAHCFGVPVEALLPAVQEVFPDGAIHAAADDPLSDEDTLVATQIVRDLSAGSAPVARKHSSSRGRSRRPSAVPSRRSQSSQ